MVRSKHSKSLVLSGNDRKSAVMKPQLTSLIDVMTILLVFLLKSFSVEGNLISVSPELRLAESSSDKAPVPALNIEVNRQNIVVDGNPIMPISRLEASDSLMIEELYNSLVSVTKSHRMIGNQGRIIIQCDSLIDFKILKKVMYTCGKAELSSFSLLVVEKA